MYFFVVIWKTDLYIFCSDFSEISIPIPSPQTSSRWNDHVKESGFYRTTSNITSAQFYEIFIWLTAILIFSKSDMINIVTVLTNSNVEIFLISTMMTTAPRRRARLQWSQSSWPPSMTAVRTFANHRWELRWKDDMAIHCDRMRIQDDGVPAERESLWSKETSPRTSSSPRSINMMLVFFVVVNFVMGREAAIMTNRTGETNNFLGERVIWGRLGWEHVRADQVASLLLPIIDIE